MLNALDHIVVVVNDLEQANADYTRLLGRPASWRGRHPALGTANALFALDNTYLELIAPEAEGGLAEVLRQRLDSHGEGPLALAFGTEDATKCAAAFNERGLSAEGPAAGEGRDSETQSVRRWHNVHIAPANTRGVPIFAIEHDPDSPGLELTLPATNDGSCIHAVDHVVVRSGDPDAARTLYGDQLGLRLALDKRFDARGLRLLFFRVGGITVEIASVLNDPKPPEEDFFWGISYRVDSVERARERIAAAGIDVSSVRAGMKPGTRVCTVRGETHGVATLLLGPEPAPAS